MSARHRGSGPCHRLDKYLVRYQRPEPRFYTAYQSARQTINTAARSPKPPTR
ncbi:hypothetical protein KLP40_08810 [Hymenobacter sp. NST-14]|uniref:hypothetical protein n=1 Tax=Hymenobacter piscis TaxID=2839984 RepID=UPI001C01312C|nr:hypothetical protein [Hymenobacter piscis]MBT9393262.1 hypothetical protein [Hymenobacter piscis]